MKLSPVDFLAKFYRPAGKSCFTMIVTGSRPQSIQDARDMVEKISQDHGYIPDDKLIGIEAGVKQLILDAMLKKDQMIGSSVIT